MGDNDGACLPTMDLCARRQLLEPGRFHEDVDLTRADEGSTAKGDRFIAVIESRPFLRECIRRSMQSALPIPVVTYSTLSELGGQLHDASAALVILSLIDASGEAFANALKDVSQLSSGRPVIALASKNEADLARAAIRHGAKGYISVTMGFEIAVEAVRFVLAGGAYVPTDCFLAPTPPDPIAAPQAFPLSGDITRRELAVVRAIQKGKPNKVIAYELNMCESTVKVHVRNIMKKWKAKNRTDVAIKAQSILSNIMSSTVSAAAAVGAA